MLKISHFIFLLATPSIYVSANRESIYTLTEEVTNLLLDYTYGTDNSTTVDEDGNPITRKGPGRVQKNYLERLNGYGCWCDFDDYKSGRGRVLDEYDTACKKLHHNFLCIEEEFENRNLDAEGDENVEESESNSGSELQCDPKTQTYKYKNIPTLLSVAIAYKMENRYKEAQFALYRALNHCKQINGYHGSDNEENIILENKCAAEICMAEVNFIYEINPGYMQVEDQSSIAVSSSLMHKNNDQFIENNNEMCGPFKKNPSPHKAEITCCGVTPFRLRYDSKRPVKCCEYASKLYNPVQECCAGNQIFPISQCQAFF